MSNKIKISSVLFLVLIVGIMVAYWWRTDFIDFPGLVSPSRVVTIDIIAAAADIPQSTIIKPEMLTTISIPLDQAMETMFFETDDVVGKVAKYPLQKGSIITRPLVTQFE